MNSLRRLWLGFRIEGTKLRPSALVSQILNELITSVASYLLNGSFRVEVKYTIQKSRLTSCCWQSDKWRQWHKMNRLSRARVRIAINRLIDLIGIDKIWWSLGCNIDDAPSITCSNCHWWSVWSSIDSMNGNEMSELRIAMRPSASGRVGSPCREKNVLMQHRRWWALELRMHEAFCLSGMMINSLRAENAWGLLPHRAWWYGISRSR